MAISRFAASRVTQGLPKYQSAWDQDGVQAGALVPIQTVTVQNVSTVEFGFSNIPQIYQDLMLVISYTKLTGTFDPWLSINGDFTGNTAGRIQMYSNISGGHSGEFRTNDSTIYIPDGGAHSSGHFCSAVINLFDYKNSNRKTLIAQVAATKASTYWTSIACATKTIGAITSLQFHGNDGNMSPGSTATLYGIKAGV